MFNPCTSAFKVRGQLMNQRDGDGRKTSERMAKTGYDKITQGKRERSRCRKLSIPAGFGEVAKGMEGSLVGSPFSSGISKAPGGADEPSTICRSQLPFRSIAAEGSRSGASPLSLSLCYSSSQPRFPFDVQLAFLVKRKCGASLSTSLMWLLC